MRTSSFLNTSLNSLPCNFQTSASAHLPVIFRPGSWLPGAFLGLTPQAKLSEASFREDTLGQSGVSHTLSRSSPTLTSGLSRQRVTWAVNRGTMNGLFQDPTVLLRIQETLIFPLFQPPTKTNLQLASNVYSWSPQINSRVLLVLGEDE